MCEMEPLVVSVVRIHLPHAGDTGNDPDPGRFYAVEQLYQCHNYKPVHPRAHAPQQEATTVRKAAPVQPESGPLSPQLE